MTVSVFVFLGRGVVKARQCPLGAVFVLRHALVPAPMSAPSKPLGFTYPVVGSEPDGYDSVLCRLPSWSICRAEGQRARELPNVVRTTDIGPDECKSRHGLQGCRVDPGVHRCQPIFPGHHFASDSVHVLPFTVLPSGHANYSRIPRVQDCHTYLPRYRL
jgi:hypothetical protein